MAVHAVQIFRRSFRLLFARESLAIQPRQADSIISTHTKNTAAFSLESPANYNEHYLSTKYRMPYHISDDVSQIQKRLVFKHNFHHLLFFLNFLLEENLV